MRLDEVPYSIVISHDEYVSNISDLSVFCKGTRKEYLLVKQNKNRRLIHFTSSDNIPSILSKGILVMDMDGTCDFGDGVYSLPVAIKRIFGMRDRVGVVFDTKDLYYYVCIDCADSIAPIGYIFFTHDIPKENIVEVVQTSDVSDYLDDMPTDINEVMYLCGMDWTSPKVIALVNQSKDLCKDLPFILKELR